MKQQVTKFYCDVCGKEVEEAKLVTGCSFLGIKNTKGKDGKVRPIITRIKDKDLCLTCATKLSKMVEVGANNSLKLKDTTITPTKSSPTKEFKLTKSMH